MEIPAFFITNTANSDNQLKQLLANPFQKIVFQFLMDPNGGLTLVAYGAKMGNKNFGPPIELGRSKQPSLKISSNVYLGNMEVGKEDEMKLLRKIEKEPAGKEYIHIVPKDIKNGRIQFEITTSDNPASLLPLAVVLNPCPPGNSD